ncbi:MAG: hypothetical protein J6R32_08525 [Bacteroidales bacterium]|nr:hypothetical protein [Bacteroidales bacterium]
MKKLFVIISALFFMLPLFCCNHKQEHSEAYLKALSYYEEGINLTSDTPLKNDSLLKALPKFIEAARLLEQLPEDMSKEEISLVSKTYHEMYKIMFLKMSFNTMIDALKRALYYQEMNIDSNMMAILTADLAVTYSSITNDTTEIMHYIRLAEPYLDTTDYIEPYLKVKSSLSLALYYIEDDDSSLLVERERMAFKNRRGLDTRKDSIALGMSLYYTPGYKLEAKPYLLKIFKIKEFPEIQRCVIMKYLADIYEEENNIDSMNLCNKYYETYFKLQEDRQLDDAYLSEQYDKYEVERDAKLNTLRKQKNKQERIILTSIIVLVILLASYIFVFNKKQYNKNILEQEDIIYNALRQHVVTIYHKQKDNIYENILKEFNTFYPDALEKFKDTYPYLTESQQAICMLSFLSFRTKEISLILNLRENTVSKYRNYITKSTGVKSLDDIIRPFIN